MRTTEKIKSITDDDRDTICIALAFAIVAIERLSDERRQRWCGREDMLLLLEALSEDQGEHEMLLGDAVCLLDDRSDRRKRLPSNLRSNVVLFLPKPKGRSDDPRPL